MRKTVYSVHAVYDSSVPVLRVFFKKSSAITFLKKCLSEPLLQFVSFDVQFAEVEE